MKMNFHELDSEMYVLNKNRIVKIFLHDCHKQISFPFPKDLKDTKNNKKKLSNLKHFCALFNAIYLCIRLLCKYFSILKMLQKV